ncbi:2-polyprenylphenol 6-hydroxylase [Taklimakanibacter albus]|uniref:2-polyprenylphenol 6-hydroxylase n=1 Tax=Taklimakanibacter albus TaxID=2800327 RepID=A0ACC5REF6_9HYPH|nr:2-polyprenylphenol 6-hydroxylase [Aestuariivirga sp. YIM B02566]MBK1871002.1 2-polyprenylphenol 6-hydroxylase [Aestuariivirga sp. YIM B02566]
MAFFGHVFRLARAGWVLARHDAFPPPEDAAALPLPARIGLRLAKLVAGKSHGNGKLSAALAELGPSYVKLGQFLATRPDMVGPARAAELRSLQDRLPPFDMATARQVVQANLGRDTDELFAEFGPPVAAASIAQVHRARTREGRDVAVKILRPGIEQRFARDLSDFFFAARMIERMSAVARRLRPVDATETLAQSVKLEMDLRMEAAAMKEMAGNVADDPGFRVPQVEWAFTARQVLTTDWIDGTPLSDLAALKATGLDLDRLADTVIQSFLRHAIRDGFFHADMHQGNLFADPSGNLIAVDFGIMGRLTPKERLFLAEILYGFIRRDYARVAQVHFDAGYVPQHQDPAVFAQALRAIGEPIMDRPAHEISMARLLTQLFEVTGQFDMATQPQLLLLQKTMVVVEGVARMLNPHFNMWVAAEPVVREWIEKKLGPLGQIEGAAEGAASLGRLFTALPEMLGRAQAATTMLADMANAGGIRLDKATTEALAAAQARHSRAGRYALVAGAAALIAIAVNLIF